MQPRRIRATHIHGFEDSGETHALVLEFVDGPPLADSIAQGAISLDEALPIATQIVEALEAAHEQGIIHRDLKPANIKLRPDGTVKVLDFGLAKLNDPNVSNVANGPNAFSMSPTITSPALMTGVGVVLGTAAYMSPEQAKGRAADKRSDIWAFGCVLYEMLTGERRQVSHNGGFLPKWSRDGQRLFFFDAYSNSSGHMMTARRAAAGLPWEEPRALFDVPRIYDFDVRRDASTIYFIASNADGAAREIRVVTNGLREVLTPK